MGSSVYCGHSSKLWGVSPTTHSTWTQRFVGKARFQLFFSSGHEPVRPSGPQQARSAFHHHKVLVRLKLLRQVSGCSVGIFFLLLELGLLGPGRPNSESMILALGLLLFCGLQMTQGLPSVQVKSYQGPFCSSPRLEGC